MFKRAIFVDTSALYPLFAPRDNLKKISIEIFEEIVDKYNANLYSTNWVIYESLSKLKKNGLERCEKLNLLIEKRIVNVISVDEELERQGLIYFWNYKDKTWGVIDCTSIAFMYNNNIKYVFGFDAHFSQAGLINLMLMEKNKPAKNYSTIDFPY